MMQKTRKRITAGSFFHEIIAPSGSFMYIFCMIPDRQRLGRIVSDGRIEDPVACFRPCWLRRERPTANIPGKGTKAVRMHREQE